MPDAHLVLINVSEKSTIEREGRTIHIMPAWKWLLRPQEGTRGASVNVLESRPHPTCHNTAPWIEDISRLSFGLGISGLNPIRFSRLT